MENHNVLKSILTFSLSSWSTDSHSGSAHGGGHPFNPLSCGLHKLYSSFISTAAHALQYDIQYEGDDKDPGFASDTVSTTTAYISPILLEQHIPARTSVLGRELDAHFLCRSLGNLQNDFFDLKQFAQNNDYGTVSQYIIFRDAQVGFPVKGAAHVPSLLLYAQILFQRLRLGSDTLQHTM